MGQMHIPVKTSWELNERHYGGLTGLDKQETVEKHGKEQVRGVHRSCHQSTHLLPRGD